MSSELNNDGLTLKYKVDDGTWATLGNLGLWSTDDYLKVNNIELNDDTLDALNYTTTTLRVDKNESKIERIDNMNIVELYYKRKKAELKARYDEYASEEYNNLDVVKEYKELVNAFEINMKQLAEKYNTNNEEPIYYNCCENEYAYELSCDLKDNIVKKYQKEYDEELNELQEFVEEVKAVLSLSDDKDYQLEVLKNYNIVDKKGMLNI